LNYARMLKSVPIARY